MIATLCAKIIVNELNTDADKKLIPPIDIGGIAGRQINILWWSYRYIHVSRRHEVHCEEHSL